MCLNSYWWISTPQTRLFEGAMYSFMLGQIRFHSEQKPSRSHPAPKPHHIRHRQLRCDCGAPAVTVLTLKVGSDPQYTIHLPLCAVCLALEQEAHRENS